MSDWREAPRWLLALTALAVGVGVFARFKGLGAAPFSVDEYYLARSIEDVLRTGLPLFDCGGYYVRGVLLQYLSAGLQSFGMAPELAPRLVGALCNLLSLPAAYWLGRRLHGPVTGLLLVVMLSISVWEVEMSRFGRMYAPFQAVFLWYTVYFVKFTVDHQKRALWGMAALSIIAPLVWEGGALVALANLLALFLLRSPGRLFWRDALPITAASLLLVAAYLFVSVDLRNIQGDEFPPGFEPSRVNYATDPLTSLDAPATSLASGGPWLLLALVPIAAAAWAAKWIWGFRRRPLLALGLAAILAAALLQQFLLAAVAASMLLLMRYIRWDEAFGPSARAFHVAIITALVFWLSYSLVAIDWRTAAGGSTAKGLAMVAYEFLAVPNFVGVVVRPWVRTLPVLGALLLMPIAVAVWRNSRNQGTLSAERAILVLLVGLVMAASFSTPPRMETRYVYFAYPLALLIALTVTARLATRLTRTQAAATAALSGLALGGFALTEDFSPGHLARIDSPEILYRSSMSADLQTHYVSREDNRELANWLRNNIPGDATLINGVHGLDIYYPDFRYFHVDETNPDMMGWSCDSGRIERWGNYPLLYTTEALADVATQSTHTYLVTFGYDDASVLEFFSRLQPRIVKRQGHLVVLELRG